MFPLVSNTGINETLPLLVEHLISLEVKLSSYMPSLNPDQYDWVSNPLMETSNDVGLRLIEELTAISTDRGFMIKHYGIAS